MCLFAAMCLARENVIKPLDNMYPRLVKKGVEVLMASDLFRPDVSTTDCMPRSTRMEEKTGVELMDVKTEEQLDKWMHVCVPSMFLQLQPLFLSP